MYPLTDFSTEHLTLLIEMIGSRLAHENQCYGMAINQFGANDSLTKTYAKNVCNLKDMKVAALTALQIVRERETINSN